MVFFKVVLGFGLGYLCVADLVLELGRFPGVLIALAEVQLGVFVVLGYV